MKKSVVGIALVLGFLAAAPCFASGDESNYDFSGGYAHEVDIDYYDDYGYTEDDEEWYEDYDEEYYFDEEWDEHYGEVSILSQMISVTAGYGFPGGIMGQYGLLDVDYQISFSNFSLCTSLYTTMKTFDAVFGGIYTPDFLCFYDEEGWKYYLVGGEAFLHLRNQNSVAFESDVLLNGRFGYMDISKGWTVLAKVGGYWKHTVIRDLKDCPMNDFGMNISLAVGKIIGGCLIHGSMATYSEHNYPLFITPIYTFGVDFVLWTNYNHTLEMTTYAEVTMCDQFTSSPYMGDAKICVGLEYWF